MIKVSIIICTHNGEKSISKTLESIGSLLFAEKIISELIIVNNNSTDNTDIIIKNSIKNILNVLHVEYHIEVKIGKKYAINTALKYVSSQWILFCDDDNILDINYLVAFDTHIKNSDNIGIIGGISNYNFDNQFLPTWLYTYRHTYSIGHHFTSSFSYPLELQYLWGAGMFVRTEIFNWLEIKKIDLLVGKKTFNHYISGEDYEICIIAKLLGFKIIHSPFLSLYHNIDSSRLKWDSFIQLNIRNSLPLIYLDLYRVLINNPFGSTEKFILYSLRKTRNEKIYLLLISSFKKIIGVLLGKSEGYSFDISYKLSIAELKEIKGISKNIIFYSNYFDVLIKHLNHRVIT